MKIKDKIVLNGINWSEADNIEYNNISAFQTSDSNMTVYYIVRWTGNAYNLQKQYTCHAFDHPVIILKSELVCPAKFMTPMIKTSYWYHEPYEAINAIVKLEQVVMPYIEFIQDDSTTNKLL